MKPVYDPQTRKLKEDLARQLHDAGFGKREAFSDGGKSKISTEKLIKLYKQADRISLGGFADILNKKYETVKGNKFSQATIFKILNRNKVPIKFSDEELKKVKGKEKLLGRYKNISEIGDVDTIKLFGKKNVAYPDQKTKTFLLNQAKLRNKFPKNSAKARELNEEGKLLTNTELAKKFDTNTRIINSTLGLLKKEYNLGDQPVIGDKQKIALSRRRREARREYSSQAFEDQYKGDVKTQLGHLSDLYNIDVRADTLGYVNNKINAVLGGSTASKDKASVDNYLRRIIKLQNKIAADKPENFREKIELLNQKGIEIASQVPKSYKVFEILDADTLKRTPFLINYSKTTDPAGIYEGKPVKEIYQLQKEAKKYEKILNKFNKQKEAVTSEEIKILKDPVKVQNYSDLKSFEINRKNVLEAEEKISKKEVKETIEKIKGIDVSDLEKIKSYIKKGQLGPDFFKKDSSLRSFVQGGPLAIGKLANALAVPYDFLTFFLGGYTTAEALAASATNLLPPQAQKVLPTTFSTIDRITETEEDKIRRANERKEYLEKGFDNLLINIGEFKDKINKKLSGKKAFTGETVDPKTGEVRELKEPIKTADDLIKDQENFEFVSSEMPTQEYKSGGRVKFQEGTNLMNVLDNMAMENMNRKLGIEFRGEIPKGVKFRTDLGTAGDPMAEARGDLTEQDIQTDDVLESEIFKIMLEKSKRDQEKLFYTKRNIEKMGGTRFIEDFPDQTEYLKAVGKDIASPRGLGYVGTKLLEGVVGGLEFIPGQAYTLAKGDLEFYQPVLPEKFGITSLAEKVKPDIRTSGLMAAGDIAKFTGEFADPFIVYGLTKKGISAFRKTPDGVSKSDEILSEIDPSRRDVLKTGAVMTGGAMAYPLAKKISLLEEAGKIAKVSRNIENAPFWFEDLINVIVKPENILKQSGTKKIYNNKGVKLIEDERSIEITFETDNGLPAYIEYIKPREIMDPKTGKIEKIPGDYQEYELVYRGEGDYYTKDIEEGINSGKGDLIRMSGNKVPKEESAKASRFADEQSAAEARMEADLDFLESQADEID